VLQGGGGMASSGAKARWMARKLMAAQGPAGFTLEKGDDAPRWPAVPP
jgi:hypothetical protein